MKVLGSFAIKSEISKLKAGTAFTWHDFEKTKLKGIRIQVELARLERKGEIERKARGVYFVPKKTLAGPAPLSDLQLVAKKLMVKQAQDKEKLGRNREDVHRLIPVGLTLFNRLGLTTQVPAHSEYISSLSFRGPAMLVKRFSMEILQDYSLEEAMSFLALSSLDSVTNEDNGEVEVLYVRYLGEQRITLARLRSIAQHVGGKRGKKAIVNLARLGA